MSLEVAEPIAEFETETTITRTKKITKRGARWRRQILLGLFPGAQRIDSGHTLSGTVAITLAIGILFGVLFLASIWPDTLAKIRADELRFRHAIAHFAALFSLLFVFELLRYGSALFTSQNDLVTPRALGCFFVPGLASLLMLPDLLPFGIETRLVRAGYGMALTLTLGSIPGIVFSVLQGAPISMRSRPWVATGGTIAGLGLFLLWIVFWPGTPAVLP